MKLNRLVLNMNYPEEVKKSIALKFMLYNKILWLEDDVFNNIYYDYIVNNSNDTEVLERLAEINQKLYFIILEEVEKWTKEISNNEKLAKSIVEQAFSGTDFKVFKVEDGIMGVDFVENVEFKSKLYNVYPEKEQTYKDTLKNIEEWEKEVEIKLDNGEEYNLKLSSDWTLEDEFDFNFSYNFGYSIQDAHL